MGTLYLVRHGQASFGADDYDVLSDLGYRQALRLGEYFKYKGISFDAAFSGTLRRQVKTLEGICVGAGLPLQATQLAGLNEYDSDAVIATIHPHKLETATTPEMYRSHFRLLKDGLKQWMDGVVSPLGMPSYTDFVSGITDVLDHIRQTLGTSPETTIELNLRIRNCSVTEFAFTPKRHMLQAYNTLPHLDAPEHAAWITYS
jgi:broad specificity phosphatase PhoE